MLSLLNGVTMHDMTYGAALRKARHLKGLKLKDLAEVLACSPAYISDVERGTRAPFCEQDVRRIAEYLGENAEEMIAIAYRSRGRFILDGETMTTVKRNLAARLVRNWDKITDDVASKMVKLIPA